MVDYVLVRKSRNIASKLTHIFLNILLGIGAVLVTVLSGSPVLGILLVVISKWRVFAVRARYFFVNLKANLVDFIVGISIVLLAYYSGTSFLIVDFVLMAIYCLWLLVIKPLSSENATLIQSVFAVFLGISAATFLTSSLNAAVMVALAFLIGYAASRHVLIQSNDKDYLLTTLICGLIFAEISWLTYTWGIVYTFGNTGIKIPQVALILTIFVYIYNYARRAMIKYHEEFDLKTILGPVIFSIVLIAIIVIGFSDPIFNI